MFRKYAFAELAAPAVGEKGARGVISIEILLTFILLAIIALGFFVILALLHVVGKLDMIIDRLGNQFEFEEDTEDERELTSAA